MGEAKRRKAKDPSYGRPKRGLIVTCPIELEPDGFLITNPGIEPHDLRHALLFWDKLVFPSNNFIHIGSTPDLEFLQAAGILERPNYFFRSGKNAEPLIQSQLQAFKEREGRPNEIWDICQNSAVLLQANAGEISRDAGLQIELLNAIPIPDKDVPLNEVIEFKRRRNDEFMALRAQIDAFVAAINSANEPQAELQLKIADLDKACADALEVSSEWQFPVHLSNQKATIDLKPFEIIAGGIAGYIGASSLGVSQALLAAVGGAAAAAKSVLKLSSDIGWRGLKRRATPFSYISHIGKELL
jgi:uncharacterized protein DUF6236